MERSATIGTPFLDVTLMPKSPWSLLCLPTPSAPSWTGMVARLPTVMPVSYTHLRAHETRHDLVCRLLLEKKKKKQKKKRKKKKKKQQKKKKKKKKKKK